MRIKKLEIIGFKSFKDKTVIHFDRGITGIVGPNGCGKSNIVDALTWVMGEMSAKHLRGSSMEDVIFAGAEGYAPMGMVEVSLTLENDGGAFPAKYARMTEIMITRRLHRSGESEYLLNKEAARLKDIQEIFMDTGAGSKGFSIIEQGAIGKIITAKPEDRRTLIEEAAGITKFKARKRESQRKLDSTDQNLVRLQDILGEQKRQLESLERQAQRAERFRNIKTQIQEKELLVASKTFFQLQLDIEELDQKLASMQERESTLLTEQSQLDADLQTLRLEVLEKEKSVELQSQEHGQLVEGVQKLETEIRELQFEIEQARRNREMTGSLLGQFEAREVALVQDFELSEQRRGGLENEVEQLSAQFEAKNDHFQTLQRRIAELDEVLTQRRRDMLTLAQTESHLDAKFQTLASQLDMQREQLTTALQIRAELQLQKDDFEKRRQQLANQLEVERQMQFDFMKDVEAFEQNIEIARGHVTAKTQEVEAFKDDLNQISSRLYGLENLQASFEGFEDGVKNVMQWQKLQHSQGENSELWDEIKPMAEVIEVPEEFELAMEGALGSKLQLLLSQKSETALNAVDFLKLQKSGRSSFVAQDLTLQEVVSVAPVQSEPGVIALLGDLVRVPTEFQAQVRSFVANVAVVDSIASAIRLRSRHSAWTFVTKEGDALSQDGILTGGTAESAQSGVVQRRREIKELSVRRDEASGKLALAQATLTKLEQTLKTLLQDLESARKKNSEQEMRVMSLRKDFERAENEERNAKQAVERSDAEVNRLQMQVQRTDEDMESVQSRLEEIRTDKNTMESEVQSADATLKADRSGIDGVQKEVTDLQVRLAQKKQELQGLYTQLETLKKSLAEVQEQLARMSSEKAKSGEVLSTHQVIVETKKLELEKRIAEVNECKLRVSMARNEYEKLNHEVRQYEGSAANRMANLNEVRQTKAESQIRLEQFRTKDQVLSHQIYERYMVQLAEIADSYRDREADVQALDLEVQELKGKLAKIGDVNLSSIKEYDELIQRYEFLNQQYKDLVESKDQLRKVIDRINRICSKRFKETFVLVNERFSKVFPVLFGGGEAQLTLIEDPEKDEMGIDIVARPPGKKLQNVSLLSGGEKALTAVSLIFSIFLVKPSPFCLLDEVDAPLDDANVARFNDLVKEMAKRSQIIVVTHNKHTMKVNNILYGVTMEEKGVSKMVSVNLVEAERVVALG